MVSCSRLGLIPFFVMSCYHQHYYNCLLMCIWALISDYVDGFLARRLSVSSSFGAVLDPAADKLFLLFALASLYLDCRLEFLYISVVFLRYSVQLLFFPLVIYYHVSFHIKPSLFAKAANCLVYFILLLELYVCMQKSFLNSFFVTLRQSLFVVSGLCEIFLMLYYPYRFYLILNHKTRVF